MWTVLRETDPQASLSLWEALLPEEARQLPAELARGRCLPGRRTLPSAVASPVRPPAWAPVGPGRHAARLRYLKHRYGLGYETLCKEVSDSIS